MTFRHWAGVSPHTLSYDFAETCVFGKQSPGPDHCNLILLRHPFSRSYGAILPSSLERVISRSLVYSTYLPVLVYGTDNFYCLLCNITSFSWKFSINQIMVLKIKTNNRILSPQDNSFFSISFTLISYTETHNSADLATFVPRYQIKISTGIFTCFPSITPFDLTLGPD